MALSLDLSARECEDLLASGQVGRIGVCSPQGPHVIPVNYVVLDGAVVFRTSPYSVVGTYARDAQVAFEVDHVDVENRAGWSVLARGRAVIVSDAQEVVDIRRVWPSDP